MSVRRYDVEWAAAPVFAQYLLNKLDPAIVASAPVITFFDPMSGDEAQRIVVTVLKGNSQKESPANYAFACKVTVKSRWAKSTVQNDMAAHFDRTNWVRDVLSANTLVNDLNAIAAAPLSGVFVGGGGLVFDFIQPRRDFDTDVRENGWIYSDTLFGFNGFFPQ